MYLSRVNITNTILNEDFIHFSKHKVKLYAHIKKKIQTTMINLCVQTNELLTSEVYLKKKRISMLIIKY
jgi:hypothetical protein